MSVIVQVRGDYFVEIRTDPLEVERAKSVHVIHEQTHIVHPAKSLVARSFAKTW